MFRMLLNLAWGGWRLLAVILCWDGSGSNETIERVRAVGEETLFLLLNRQADDRTAGEERRLLLIAGSEDDAAVLEFIASTDETNSRIRWRC